MQIGLLGYGRMGKAIEALALAREHTIGLIVDSEHPLQSKKQLSGLDVVIDFSMPVTAARHIRLALEGGIPVVSGTTGWLEHKEEMDSLCKSLGGAFLYASNFSIGMNILFQVNRYLTTLCNNFPQYLATVSETHHIKKVDKPSGTAITIAEDLISWSGRYASWVCDPDSSPPENALIVSSIREGDVKGKHTVEWRGPFDMISLSHEAFRRDAFAEGALQAAEWLTGRQGVFSFEDLLPA